MGTQVCSDNDHAENMHFWSSPGPKHWSLSCNRHLGWGFRAFRIHQRDIQPGCQLLTLPFSFQDTVYPSGVRFRGYTSLANDALKDPCPTAHWLRSFLKHAQMLVYSAFLDNFRLPHLAQLCSTSHPAFYSGPNCLTNLCWASSFSG